ncbi:MAG TPA: hypothetical protein PKD28_01540 [Candidatus Saccharibacteria bacterium]|nr:hypothetical protein [Candidatus Saccharibacteria bacterium]
MTNLEPPHIPGEHDPLADLGLFEMDPKVRGIIAAVHQAQIELPTDLTDSDERSYASRVGCGKLNSYLMEIGLFNDSVSLYGKVRLAPWLNEEDRSELLADSFFRERGLYKGEDHRGEYWRLADHGLRVGPIDTDRSEDDESSPVSYLMTFRTEYQARLIEEEHDDPEIAGGLIMYPDDIDYMRPSVLSDQYVEQILMMQYPDLYARILELLPGEGWYDDNEAEVVTDALALKRLACLEIPATLSLPADFRESLGAFLFARLDLDNDAGHIFEGYASVEGLDDDGEWVRHKGKKRKLRGNVIAVEIDQKTHKISYIVTELAPGSVNAGIELRKIPATPELKVQSSRSTHKRFGKAAMWQFDSDEDALQWYRARDKRAILPELEQFVTLVDTIDTTEFDLREQPDRYEVSIEDSLISIGQEFQRHSETVRGMVDGGEITVEHTRMFPSLGKKFDLLGGETAESHCVFTHNITFGFPDKDHPDQVTGTVHFDAGDNMALRGTIVDFRGAWFTSVDQSQPAEFALAAIMTDPILVPGNDGDKVAPLAADVVAVRMDDPKLTKGYRITYKRDMEEWTGQ